MYFNDFTINKADFDFYNNLTKEEKIWFLHDLICSNSYGNGSTEIVKPSTKPDNMVLADFDTIVDSYEEQMKFLVNSTINLENEVNVLIVNKFVVINAISEEAAEDELFDMFYEGFVMVPYPISPKAVHVFQHQDICVVYEILGKERGFCEN